VALAEQVLHQHRHHRLVDPIRPRRRCAQNEGDRQQDGG